MIELEDRGQSYPLTPKQQADLYKSQSKRLQFSEPKSQNTEEKTEGFEPKRSVLILPRMATSKSYYARPNYRYLSGDHHHQHQTLASDFELDESDIYNFGRSNSPEYRKPIPSSRGVSAAKNRRGDSGHRSDMTGGKAASLPVGIPDWSKILRGEYRENRRCDDDEADGDIDVEGGVRIPPHEFLARQMARTRIVSFSVHEGVGRTLKGRDLSRVRNAIWEKTGFED
ncbi:unnamed protein product [Malus baccata var. baccata]